MDWKTISETPVEEQSGFDDLPAGVWCLGATATVANGGAAPTVKLNTIKTGDRRGQKYYTFNVGLLAKGGDAALDPKYKDRYMFFSCSVHPFEADDEADGPRAILSGRLVGFINALYAPGVGLDLKDKKERAALRWRALLTKLAEVEKAHPEFNNEMAINEITQQPDMGLTLLQLVVAGIENDSRLVLFKTGMSKAKQGYEPRVEIKQFEDAVPDNMSERKVQSFDAIGVVTGAQVPGF